MRRATAEDDGPPQTLGHEPEKCSGELRILVTVKLNRRQTGFCYRALHTFHRLIHKHTDFLQLQGQIGHDRLHGFHSDSPRTLLVKHEPQRIRARVHRGMGVFGVRNSANFDPSHKKQWIGVGDQLKS